MAGRGLDGEGIVYFRKGSKEDILKEVAFQLNPERGGREPWEGLEEGGTSCKKRIWDKEELACSRKKKKKPKFSSMKYFHLETRIFM